MDRFRAACAQCRVPKSSYRGFGLPKAPSYLLQCSFPDEALLWLITYWYWWQSTGQTYNITNIPYAQPPLGDLRFAAPIKPQGRNPVVQAGSIGAVCPHALPVWQAIATDFVGAVVTGHLPFNYDTALAALKSSNTSVPIDGRTKEDCLVLDVIVPKEIFDTVRKSDKRRNQPNGAPVLVWIHVSPDPCSLPPQRDFLKYVRRAADMSSERKTSSGIPPASFEQAKPVVARGLYTWPWTIAWAPSASSEVQVCKRMQVYTIKGSHSSGFSNT